MLIHGCAYLDEDIYIYIYIYIGNGNGYRILTEPRGNTSQTVN